jgi:ribosomal protein L20
MSRRGAAGDGSLYYKADKGLWVAQHEGVYRYSKDKARAMLNLWIHRNRFSVRAKLPSLPQQTNSTAKQTCLA